MRAAMRTWVRGWQKSGSSTHCLPSLEQTRPAVQLPQLIAPPQPARAYARGRKGGAHPGEAASAGADARGVAGRRLRPGVAIHAAHAAQARPGQVRAELHAPRAGSWLNSRYACAAQRQPPARARAPQLTVRRDAAHAAVARDVGGRAGWGHDCLAPAVSAGVVGLADAALDEAAAAVLLRADRREAGASAAPSGARQARGRPCDAPTPRPPGPRIWRRPCIACGAGQRGRTRQSVSAKAAQSVAAPPLSSAQGPCLITPARLH